MLNALSTDEGRLDRLVRMVLARPGTFVTAIISLGLVAGLAGAMLTPGHTMCSGTYNLSSISNWN